MKFVVMLAATLWSGLLLAAQGDSSSATATPQELVAGVERASHSIGYRLRATLTQEGQEAGQSLRVLIAGQKDEQQQKLLIRALAPQAFRDQFVVLESASASALRAIQHVPGDGAATRAFNPYNPLFDSSLIPWELLGEWWRWPQQFRIREESLLGQDCVVIDSRGGRGPVARVRSWIAPQLRTALRIEFYRADGTLLHAIRVDKIFRRADGTGAARVMTLTDATLAATRLEVYNGEEGISLAPETFAPPVGAKNLDVQDSK